MRKNCSSWSFQICGTLSMLIAFMSCSSVGCCFEDCFAMTWVAPAQWPGYAGSSRRALVSAADGPMGPSRADMGRQGAEGYENCTCEASKVTAGDRGRG